MDCQHIKSAYLEAISEHFDCRAVSPTHSIVSSHTVGLDGDFFEVHVLEQSDGSYVLSDMGEGLRDLANLGIELSGSDRRLEVVSQIQSLLDVRLEKGRFQSVVPRDDLSDGLLRMFQALSFVGDLSFTASPREESEFKTEVGDVLRPIGRHGSFSKDVEFKGASGRSYKVDFHVYVVRDVWIDAITAASAGSYRAQVNSTYVKWSDALNETTRRITLLDDTIASLMDAGDPALMSRVSEVELWSDRESFRRRVVELTERPA